MEQMVIRLPQLLSFTLENVEAHVKFLVTRIGVSEANLGKVQDCLLYPYSFN
jgi:hypothetical protein